MTNAEAIKELREIYTDVPEIKEAYQLAISALERDRWISVEERLPEEHVFVLICNDDEKQMIAERYDGDWWYRYFAYDTDRWDENEQGRVVAWRPLPEPPKEEI